MEINWKSLEEKARTGAYLASNSFGILWKHKILLVYLCASFGIYLLLQLISYNVKGYDMSFLTGIQGVGPLFDLSRWYQYISFWLVNFFYILLITFLSVSLIYHADKIIDNEKTSIQKSLKHATKKIQPILIWSTIVSVISYVLQVLSNRILQHTILLHPLMVIVLLLGISWSLMTVIVLPILSLENISILEAIKKSIEIVKQLIIVILSGSIWILIIASLAMILPSLPLFIQFPGIIEIIATTVILLIRLIISTTQVIFKTMVYNYYMKPLEELKALKYPRF